MAFDPQTGLLWAGDVGENHYEEVSPRENYGWNILEGLHCFRPEFGCISDGTTLPLFEYSHDDGCSVTGGEVYRGENVPSLEGWYVFGEFCTGQTWAFYSQTAKSGGVVVPVTLWEQGPAISSFASDSEGDLYFLSFDDERIFRVIDTP